MVARRTTHGSGPALADDVLTLAMGLCPYLSATCSVLC